MYELLVTYTIIGAVVVGLILADAIDDERTYQRGRVDFADDFADAEHPYVSKGVPDDYSTPKGGW